MSFDWNAEIEYVIWNFKERLYWEDEAPLVGTGEVLLSLFYWWETVMKHVQCPLANKRGSINLNPSLSDS